MNQFWWKCRSWTESVPADAPILILLWSGIQIIKRRNRRRNRRSTGRSFRCCWLLWRWIDYSSATIIRQNEFEWRHFHNRRPRDDVRQRFIESFEVLLVIVSLFDFFDCFKHLFTKMKAEDADSKTSFLSRIKWRHSPVELKHFQKCSFSKMSRKWANFHWK